MNRRASSVGLTAVLCMVWATAAFAAKEGEAIAAGLDAARPAATMTERRQAAIKALDSWITQPGSDRDPAVIAYYQAVVDRALGMLEREKITSGVRIFQLYSSSVIVQTPETVFAFDLDQGPNVDLTKTPSEEGIAFRLADAQVAKIASLVKYSFHTHAHSDHVDYQLTKALLDARRTVIVTEDNKRTWAMQPWGDRLMVLGQTVDAPAAVGPLKVHVLCDHQWNNAAHTSGMPCNAYVIETPGGVAVMTKGDINCGLQLYGWLSLLKQRGRHVDVVVGSTLFWRGVNTLAEWNRLFSPLWLPGHAWEFEHRKDTEPKGNCAAFFDAWLFTRIASGSEKVQVLSWGEWIDVGGR
jgi:L-ascorbate metabolism protein UlaG (beta-lactamase superfamily)